MTPKIDKSLIAILPRGRYDHFMSCLSSHDLNVDLLTVMKERQRLMIQVGVRTSHVLSWSLVPLTCLQQNIALMLIFNELRVSTLTQKVYGQIKTRVTESYLHLLLVMVISVLTKHSPRWLSGDCHCFLVHYILADLWIFPNFVSSFFFSQT